MFPPRRARGADPIADWLDDAETAAPREKTVAEELEGTMFTDPVRNWLLTSKQPSIHERPGSVRNIERTVDTIFQPPQFVRDAARSVGQRAEKAFTGTNLGKATAQTLRAYSPAIARLMSEDPEIASAQLGGFLAGSSEATGEQITPFNVVTAGRGMMGRGVYNLGTIAGDLAEAAGGGFQTGMAIPGVQKAVEEGRWKDAAIEGGSAALGLLQTLPLLMGPHTVTGQVVDEPGTLQRRIPSQDYGGPIVEGEVLPPEPGQLRGGPGVRALLGEGRPIDAISGQAGGPFPMGPSPTRPPGPMDFGLDVLRQRFLDAVTQGDMQSANTLAAELRRRGIGGQTLLPERGTPGPLLTPPPEVPPGPTPPPTVGEASRWQQPAAPGGVTRPSTRAAAPGLSPEDLANLRKQGFTDDLIAQIEGRLTGAITDADPTGTGSDLAAPLRASETRFRDALEQLTRRQELDADFAEMSRIVREPDISDLPVEPSAIPQGQPGDIDVDALLEELFGNLQGVGRPAPAEPPTGNVAGELPPRVSGQAGGPLDALTELVQRAQNETGVGYFDDPHVDPLTNLGNRRAWELAGNQPGRLIGRIDLDNFKALNDALGHGEGDRALQIVGETLRKFARRQGDVAARLGGDEFGLNIEAGQPGGITDSLRDSIESAIADALGAAGLGEAGGKRVGASLGFGADEAAADLAAIARKKERGVSKPREGVESPNAGNTGLSPTADALPVAGRPDLPAGTQPSPEGVGAPVRPPEDVYFDELLADARANGFTGTDAELRSLYDDNVRATRELIEDLDQVSGEFGPQALFQEIRRRGGIKSWEIDSQKKLAGAKGKKARLDEEMKDVIFNLERVHGLRGASSIMRDKGMSPDYMARSLAETGWPGITDDPESLMSLIRQYAAGKDEGWASPKLLDALEGQGIKPGERWWDPSRFDESFDFTDTPTGRQLEPDATNPDYDRVPFEVADDSTQFALLDRVDRSSGRLERVPIDELIATQPTVTRDVVEGYRTSERPDLDALPQQTGRMNPETVNVIRDADGKLYLAGGTHRATADWLNGKTDIQAVVYDAKADPLADVLATGEVQPRLPEAGTVRNQEVATPEFEAPFALTPEASKAPDAVQTGLAVLDDIELPDTKVSVGKLAQEEAARLGPTARWDDILEAVETRLGRQLSDIETDRVMEARIGFTPEGGPDTGAASRPTSLLSDKGEGAPPPTTPAVAPEPAGQAAPVPQNIKDFLVKRLNYLPGEVDAMGADAAFALGNKVRLHPGGVAEGIKAFAKEPQTPATFRSSDPGPNLGEGSMRVETDELAKLLNIADRGTALQRTRVEPGEGTPATPKLSRTQLERAQSMTVESEAARAAAKEPKTKVTQAEAASAKGDMVQNARRMKKLLDEPTPENLDEYARLLGEQAERQAARETKGGTSKEGGVPKHDRTGEYLASGLGGFEKLYKERPDLFWAMIRGGGGALVGALASDEEDPLAGALAGAAVGVAGPKIWRQLRAVAPTAAKALKETLTAPAAPTRQVRQGRDLSKDIGGVEMFLGQPHRTVPDVWKDISPVLEDLAAVERDSPSTTPRLFEFTRKMYIEEAIGTIRQAAKQSKAQGQHRRARYLEELSADLKGDPTVIERFVSDMTSGKMKPKDVRKAMGRLENAVYTSLLGFALDTGVLNRTQISLAFPHIKLEGLRAGVKAARTPEGKAATKHLEMADPIDAPNLPHVPVGLVRKVVNTALSPVRAGDIQNRKEVFLGAMYHARKQGLDPRAAHEFASELVAQTQGTPGELGANPFHRHLGPLRMFTKYPSIWGQWAADIATHPDPAVRRRGLALMLGAPAVLGAVGINAWNIMFPRLTASVPAAKAVGDVATHIPGVNELTGKADHTLAEDFPNLARYPSKVMRELRDLTRYGTGEHPEFDRQGSPRGEHGAWEGFLSLLGIETTGRAKERKRDDEAFSFIAESSRKRGMENRDRRVELRDAIESGDKKAASEAMAGMTPDQIREFYRRDAKSRYQLLLERVPKADRAEFEKRFKDRF